MVRFPEIAAADLDGRTHDLPGGLPAGPQVLLEMWKARLQPLERAYPCLGVRELAVLSRVYAPARPFIDGGMRAGIADPAARRMTLTAYVDLAEFASALGDIDLETVHALLLGPDGDVVWHGSGKPEADQLAALEERLAWWAQGPEQC
jgi:hypothetical protein